MRASQQLALASELRERYGTLPEHHVPDLLAPGLKVVFCGTALGFKSAQAKAYYANPGNFFWRTLHQTGLTPELLQPRDYARTLEHGIGLTDLCKTAYGQDAELPKDAFDSAALRQKIERYQPAILAFTSKTGAHHFLSRPTAQLAYGLQPERIGSTEIFVLPSPSGQARIFWDPSVWQQLADRVCASSA